MIMSGHVPPCSVDAVLHLLNVEFFGGVSSHTLGPDDTKGHTLVQAGVSAEVHGSEFGVKGVVDGEHHAVHEGPPVGHEQVEEARPGGHSGVELLGEQVEVTLRVVNGHVHEHGVEFVHWVDPVSVGPVGVASVVGSITSGSVSVEGAEDISIAIESS